jgi:hypothetical protein
LADDSKKQQADAQFRKIQRAEDGKKAMAEYEAGVAAVRVKTAKLRELRLARDAAELAAAPVAAAKSKSTKSKPAKSKPAKSKAAKKATKASESLSDWLKDRADSGHSN